MGVKRKPRYSGWQGENRRRAWVLYDIDSPGAALPLDL
jgi:hypothetical protein